MARPPVVAFTGGEVDQYTLARVDLDIAPQTAECMKNVSLTLQGAMELAPGTQHLGSTPGNGVAILRSWVYSTDIKFALELSNLLVRFIFGTGLVQLAGALATVGSFTDASAALPGGGDPPPDGGGGSGGSLSAYAGPESAFGIVPFSSDLVSVVVTGGVGPFTYVWNELTASPIVCDAPLAPTTTFSSPFPANTQFTCTVTDTGTGLTVTTNAVLVLLTSGEAP